MPIEIQVPAMRQQSSGILLFRIKMGRLQVMLVHPGGPFWARKDRGAWSIPKGLMEEGESPLAAARREFSEETGFQAEGRFLDLGEVTLSSGKTIHAFALEMDLDESRVTSQKFSLNWPKGSGKMREYPEIDRAGWFDIGQAEEKIHRGQVTFLSRLMQILNLSNRVLPAGMEDLEFQENRRPHSPSQSVLSRWSKNGSPEKHQSSDL